jgi:hypothetical protein
MIAHDVTSENWKENKNTGNRNQVVFTNAPQKMDLISQISIIIIIIIPDFYSRFWLTQIYKKILKMCTFTSGL